MMVPVLSHAQRARVAAAVLAFFYHPDTWTQSVYGKDENGDPVEMDDLQQGTYCRCLSGAIRVAVADELGQDICNLTEACFSQSHEDYVAVGQIPDAKNADGVPVTYEGEEADWHSLAAVAQWNDAEERTFHDVRELCVEVVERLSRA